MKALLTVVAATSNEGKMAELRESLGDLPVHLVSVKEILGEAPLPFGEGATFEANAERKALVLCAATGLVAVADDGGLEVTALGGRPGVRSARFAHERATDAENNAALLRELEEIDDEARTARFRCALALASPWMGREVRIVEGRVEGAIARTPRGSGGFGYDPLFVVAGEDRAMAELTGDERPALSHRVRAARAMRPVLLELVDAQLAEVDRLTR